MKIRFRYFPEDKSRDWWVKLFEVTFATRVEIVTNSDDFVDVSITGPYYPGSDHFITPFGKRLTRGFLAVASKGKQVASKALSTGVGEDRNSRKNVWFSGENERPPFGKWDCYLGFDYHFRSSNYFYLPLWQLTSVDLGLGLPSRSYWGAPILSSQQLVQRRELTKVNRKFACAFIGKAYSGRLHLIEKLKSIGKIDVYGQAARRPVQIPYEIAREYKFCVVIENDFYPGYVTEKPLEAYLSTTIPIYAGLDVANLLNRKAIVNLFDFNSERDWIGKISQLSDSVKEYRQVFEQPILEAPVSIEELIYFLQKNLA